MGKQNQYDFGGADDELPESDTGDATETASDSPSESVGESASKGGSDKQSWTEVGEIDVSSLPLKLRRNNVTDFRENKTIKLLDETRNAMEGDVLRFLADEFDEETVHKTDVFEIIVWNGLYDENGDIDKDGLKRHAKNMGYGINSNVD